MSLDKWLKKGFKRSAKKPTPVSFHANGNSSNLGGSGETTTPSTITTKRTSDADILFDMDDQPPHSATDSAFGIEEPDRIDFMLDLPVELAVCIMKKVPDIRAAKYVSKRWNLVTMDNDVWHAQYGGRFGFSDRQREKYYIPRDWRSLYQARLRLLQNWKEGHVESFAITGHTDSVYCIQYDSEKIVTGSRDRTVCFWDIRTHKCYKTLRGHTGSVLCLYYNKDILVSGSSDTTLIVWDIKTGDILHRLSGHTQAVLDLRFQGDTLYTCSKDSTIRVWSISTGALIRTLEGHHAAVNALHIHGDRLVSASGDCLVKLWDLKTGTCIRDFTGHSRGLACVQFDGKVIASGSNDQTIKIWDADTGECLRTLVGHEDLVRTLCFDSEHLVSGGYDQSIKVWNMKTGDLMLNFKDAHTSWVFHVQLDPSKIISASQDRKVMIWDFSKQEESDSLSPPLDSSNMLLYAHVSMVLFSFVFFANSISAISPTDYTLIFASAITPRFEGWGTSLGWWAEFTGTTPADPLLSRYNGVAAFQTAPGVWNWDADKAQRRVAIDAQKAGVNIVEAYSNSPPWWMTVSGTSRGNYNGGDNLDKANFTQFANYLATSINSLRKNDGIDITSLEPFNEPNSMWWKASTTDSQQEGCTFLPATQTAFLPVLKSAMDKYGLTSKVDVTTADEFAYNWSFFNRDSGASYSSSGKVNVHGYGYSTSLSWNLVRQTWRASIPSTVSRVWQSESAGFGQTASGTISMASNIIQDLNIARVSAWMFWQALDGNLDWSLIQPVAGCPTCSGLNPDTFDPSPSPGFYAFMQFSKHIPGGSVILASSRSADLDPCVICVVVSWHPLKSQLSIVAVNTDPLNSYTHRFDMSRLVGVSASTPIVAYRTDIARNELHKMVNRPVATAKGTFSYTLGSMSITTFLLSGVKVNL
ncbi:hypothetical protein BASA62_008993 [Batrachochytrium salamandrivorans]|nr:hypothetical protein BASA62_008993 [Batrachochytrium salamandrivorans]